MQSNPFGGNRGTPKPFGNSVPQDPWESSEDEFGYAAKNPFAANVGNPTSPVNERTPIRGRSNNAIKATTIFSLPPAADDQSEIRNQILMYAVLGATIVVAFGVVAWKFFLRL